MLNITDSGKTLNVKFESRMDTFKSQEIEKELDSIVSKGEKKVIFDLEDVMYISSYFLRLCLNTLKTTGKDMFIIQNVRPDIKKAFTIAGFDQQLNIK